MQACGSCQGIKGSSATADGFLLEPGRGLGVNISTPQSAIKTGYTFETGPGPDHAALQTAQKDATGSGPQLGVSSHVTSTQIIVQLAGCSAPRRVHTTEKHKHLPQHCCKAEPTATPELQLLLMYLLVGLGCFRSPQSPTCHELVYVGMQCMQWFALTSSMTCTLISVNLHFTRTHKMTVETPPNSWPFNGDEYGRVCKFWQPRKRLAVSLKKPVWSFCYVQQPLLDVRLRVDYYVHRRWEDVVWWCNNKCLANN